MIQVIWLVIQLVGIAIQVVRNALRQFSETFLMTWRASLSF
jgi:hypothetical protein